MEQGSWSLYPPSIVAIIFHVLSVSVDARRSCIRAKDRGAGAGGRLSPTTAGGIVR